MPDILIRGLTVKTLNRLKARAADNNRSLQMEVKELLERSVETPTMNELRREAKEFAKRFENRKMTDSTVLIRDDRRR